MSNRGLDIYCLQCILYGLKFLRYKSSTPTSQEHYLSVHELGIGNTKPFLFSELYNRVKALLTVHVNV